MYVNYAYQYESTSEGLARGKGTSCLSMALVHAVSHPQAIMTC